MEDNKDIVVENATVEPKIEVVDIEDLEAVLGGAANTGATGGTGTTTAVSNDTTMCPW